MMVGRKKPETLIRTTGFATSFFQEVLNYANSEWKALQSNGFTVESRPPATRLINLTQKVVQLTGA